VYDVTTFISRHPGGRVITTALGRDGSILFETHHNLLDDMSAVYKIMGKLQIGVIDKYQPVVKFDSPLGTTVPSGNFYVALPRLQHRDAVNAT
jgi:cytochrome b involved in lipid metabolism